MGKLPFKCAVFVEVALLVFAICMNVTTSSAQNGFLSIDCGSTQAPYNDKIGLSWVGDGSYTRTGSNSNLNPDSNISSDATDNRQALQDFRYFPEPRSKHCYELPTTSNISYLIRAMFYRFETEALRLSIQFDVFINGTNWFTVTYNGYTTTPLNVQEGIFFSPGNVIYLCLQPIEGVPFISSLELRPLDADGIMYSYIDSAKQYLTLLVRQNAGATSGSPTVRFPDDSFDRFWYTPNNSETLQCCSDSFSVPVSPDNTTSALQNNVPPKVMLDAWGYEYLYDGPSPGILLYYNLPSTTPVADVYVALYFQELNASAGGQRAMQISWDGGDDIDPVFNVTDRALMQSYPSLILEAYQIDIQLESPNIPEFFYNPIINALEIYAQYNFNISTTEREDVQAIQALQTSFNLTDWQGDPCAPVPYDWLTCTSYTNLNKDLCTSSDSTICTQQGYLPTLYPSVITLTLSNLTRIGFARLESIVDEYTRSGAPIFLESLLQVSITHSEVDSPTFQSFIVNFIASGYEPTLINVDFSYNEITALPTTDNVEFWKYGLGDLAYLNLSNNAFGGEVPSFFDASFTDSLQELNLSYNAMTSFPTKWGNITSLVILDLSHNNLLGSITSLDELAAQSSASLKELHISDNNLSGTFSDHLYFSGLPNLKICNFDRNHIEGRLNLSTWLETLKRADLNANASIGDQLFSFVNNSISDITPSATDFQTTIDSLLIKIPNFNKTGILLGGNPYCKHAKSHTQLYLCRSTIYDKIPGMEKRNLLPLILGTIAGVVAFSLFSVLIITISKLWKQVKVLQEVEKALADRQVQPRYYLYNDLKRATRDFHMENKLGHGAFGVVYKGDLPDGTTLGVKKLFTSTQHAQVLTEFLNEVVLITGIKHRNLVQLKGCCIEDKQRILVYEYVENGNLSEALWGSKAHGSLNWEQRWDICVGVARGLSYLHEELQPCIIHRDIKPANILLDKNYMPKIADFGLARPFFDDGSQSIHTHIAGTLGYFSPEYATQGQLTEKADVYSYGIVVLEIVSGRKCIDHSLSSERVFLKDWVTEMRQKGMLLEILQSQLRDQCVEAEVIRAINIGILCVQVDPHRRPTMSQVVTMFSRNMDVTPALDKFDSNLLDLTNHLLASDNDTHPLYLPGLGSIEEDLESHVIPLLNIDSQHNSGLRTNSHRSHIELSLMSGR